MVISVYVQGFQTSFYKPIFSPETVPFLDLPCNEMPFSALCNGSVP